jgi:hypothetical protein
VLLALARRGMGSGTAQRLEDAFIRERVRWTLSAVGGHRQSPLSVTGSREIRPG